MVGDLSRHIVNCKSEERKTSYSDQSKRWKNLSLSQFQTIYTHNSTQGAIEQHFYDLKHNWLVNRRFRRLDDFVIADYKELMTQIMLFADSFIHHGRFRSPTQPKKRLKGLPKETPIVLSKYKKNKAQNLGFYTSQVAANNIRYGNKRAIPTDSLPADSSPEAALLTDAKQLVPTPQLPLMHSALTLKQGFPTFFAARTPLSGQSILSTPQKILLYKRYISCSVTQGSSYPLMFNLVPLGGTSTPGREPLL